METKNILLTTVKLLFGPASVIVFWILTRHHYSGFWPELFILATFVALIIGLNIGWSKHQSGQETMAVTLLTITTMDWVTLFILSEHNPEAHSLGLAPLLISGGLTLILLMKIALRIKGSIKFRINGFRYYLKSEGFAISIFALFGAFNITTLLMVYANFGTQFIWLPIIILAIFHLFFWPSADYLNKFESERTFFFYLFLALIPIGLISTIYQFWFRAIFGKMLLWEALVYLAAASIFLYLIYLITKLARQKKRQKIEQEAKKAKEKAALIKATNDKAEAERKAEELQEQITKLQSAASLNWNEIFFLYKNGATTYPGFIKQFSKNSLLELLTISKTKKQLVWKKDGLILAIRENSSLFYSSYNDEELEALAQQLDDFVKTISEHTEYLGYKNLIDEINQIYDTYFSSQRSNKPKLEQ